MLTIFTTPKPFVDDHIRIIQRNAIRSWLRLTPRPDIILFGDEAGTAEICAEFSLRHVPVVERNEFGTPLLNDIFAKAEAFATTDLLCYSNADIILMDDFMESVSAVKKAKRRFLMGGRPWNLDVTGDLDSSGPWARALADRVSMEGSLRSEWACDYFVFPRGLWGNLPPFAVGRAGFDNALLYRARRNGGALVDATPATIAVHQNHTYPGHLGGDNFHTNAEALRNVALAGGSSHLRTWGNATHVVKGGQVRLRLNLWGWLNVLPPTRFISKWRRWVWFPLLTVTRPVRRRLGFGVRKPV